ncbi:MAG TPA: MBL fold metallo-hydrolase [Myxococcota bacterium]|jgi:glyoxylase-like metal-dependent hydrolase (beta-lactamase superfamily II)
MRRILVRIALALIGLLAVLAIYAYQQVTALETERVTDDVHVLFGLGGNVGVLATGRGAVIVDSMTFRMQGAHIRELAEKVGRGPTQAIINTHFHRDHTHGNPAFAAGTQVWSTQRTRDYLLHFDAPYWEGAAAGTLPNQTFEEAHELSVGDKTIRLQHLGRGHTGGDLVVLFVEDRVLHTGDLFFNGRYPNIDLEAGGSVREWIATLDRVMALDFDRVIPGHGPVTDREGLRAFQGFLRELWSLAEQGAREGKSLAETQALPGLTADAGYQTIAVPLVFKLDREFVIRRAWEEATGAVAAAQVPARPVD